MKILSKNLIEVKHELRSQVFEGIFCNNSSMLFEIEIKMELKSVRLQWRDNNFTRGNNLITFINFYDQTINSNRFSFTLID